MILLVDFSQRHVNSLDDFVDRLIASIFKSSIVYLNERTKIEAEATINNNAS